jgi:hypothetical protein
MGPPVSTGGSFYLHEILCKNIWMVVLPHHIFALPKSLTYEPERTTQERRTHF